MNSSSRRLRTMYVVGIALNAVALVAAASSGATLYAGTFGLILVYLGIRYWMVTTD
ncbi:hypothetical protein [Natronobacterium haloterrestre]|nr:hypothetical protein [Halobiforma haloterrestris]